MQNMRFIKKIFMMLILLAFFPIHSYAKVVNPDRQVTIYNNSLITIFPVIRTGNGVERRIYVAGKTGIPSQGSATVIIPKNMRNAGQILLFSSTPFAPELHPPTSGLTPYGQNSLIYEQATVVSFPFDAPYQLTEYTIDTRSDQGNETAPDNGIYNINYSGVDHLTLPVAVQAVSNIDKAGAGYVGATQTVELMQKKIQEFTDGTDTMGYFSADTSKKIGWPYFTISDKIPKSAATLKIPGGFNVFALESAGSTLFPGQPMLTVVGAEVAQGQPPASTITNAITSHWLGWVTDFNQIYPSDSVVVPGTYAKECTDQFCQDFAKTVQDVWAFAKENGLACKDVSKPIPNPTFDQAKCIVQQLIGYLFKADTHLDSRDKFIALMHGVPSLDASYKSLWYPSPNATLANGMPNTRQKYNLNPLVWLVHEQIKFPGYAFSIDDGSSYLQTQGAGMILTVGGPAHLPVPFAYNSHTQQKINIGPNWAYLSNVDGALGGCQLIQPNDPHGPAGSATCLVTLRGDFSQTRTQFTLFKAPFDPKNPSSNSYINLILDALIYNRQKGYYELSVLRCVKKIFPGKETDCRTGAPVIIIQPDADNPIVIDIPDAGILGN